MDVEALRTAASGVGMTIRDVCGADLNDIREALTDCRAFSDLEVRVAVDMAGCGEYRVRVIESDGKFRAYACIGRATLSNAAWYVYWFCVHPDAQGQGYGRALQAHIEELVREAGGDRLVLETSGRPDYARTRRFYASAGFREVGRIPEFYKPGDDCVVYFKELPAKEASPAIAGD